MTSKENIKLKIAKRVSGRVSSGLYFLEMNEEYFDDIAYARSLQILLSYNFELILKTIIILESLHKTKKSIDKEIRGHDLYLLSKKMNHPEAEPRGIPFA